MTGFFGRVAALVLCGSLAVEVTVASAQAIPDWAHERTAAWYGAFNAGDAARLAGMHTDDAVLLLAGLTIEGPAQIQAFHASQFEKVRFNCAWTIQGVSIVDRLAAVWGTDACVETPKSGAPPVKWNGRFMTLYQLQPDGTWMVIRDTGEEDRRW